MLYFVFCVLSPKSLKLTLFNVVLLFSVEKYARHHTPDPPSPHLLNGVDTAEDNLSHRLNLSPLSREQAGPAPDMTEVITDLISLLYLVEMMNLSRPSVPTTS